LSARIGQTELKAPSGPQKGAEHERVFPLSLRVCWLILVLGFLVFAAQRELAAGTATPPAFHLDGPGAIASGPLPEPGRRIVILHTNDLHSCFEGLGPDALFTAETGDGDPVQGHYARLRSLIAANRAVARAEGAAAVVCDSGDAMFGTLFHTLGPHPRSEFVPELQFFADAGYDAIGWGNHDFEAGEAGLATMLAKAAARGLAVPYVVSNALVPESAGGSMLAPRADEGSGPVRIWRCLDLPCAPSDGISSGTDGGGTNFIKVGFLGVVGPNAAKLCLAGRSQVRFFGYEDESGKENWEALADRLRPLVHRLRSSEKVDLIILLLHGGTPEAEKIAGLGLGIDVILAAHNHVVETKVSGSTTISQAGWGGAVLGRLELAEVAGKWVLQNAGATMIPVDDAVPADPRQLDIHGEYKADIARVFPHLHFAYDDPICIVKRDLRCRRFPDHTFGTLIASALRAEVNRRLERPVDLYLLSAGLIRADLPMVNGQPTRFQYSDIFRVLPLGFDEFGNPGSPIVTFWLKPDDVRILLEAMITYGAWTSAYEPVVSDSLTFSWSRLGIPLYNRVGNLMLHGKPLAEFQGLVHIAACKYLVKNLQKIGTITRGWVEVTPRMADGAPLTTLHDRGLPREFDVLADWLAAQQVIEAEGAVGSGAP
jgi:5'-nucleotidase / UDP-sugar diphosphatase